MVTFRCKRAVLNPPPGLPVSVRKYKTHLFFVTENKWIERYEQKHRVRSNNGDSVKERWLYSRDNDTSFGHRSSVKEPSQPVRTAAGNPRRGDKTILWRCHVNIPPLFSTGGQLIFLIGDRKNHEFPQCVISHICTPVNQTVCSGCSWSAPHPHS